MKMEYIAMVRRGWPNGSAVDMAETIESGSTLQNGDWVTKSADGGVAKVSTTLGSTSLAGLVMEGNGDAASASNSNKAVVLWSGFVADISNYDPAPTYVPGSLLVAGSTSATTGTLTLQTVSTQPVIATVLNVTPASASNTACLTILVK